MGLGSQERVDKFGCANEHAYAFQASYSEDIKLWFCKILFIEFTETLERGVVFDVLEHKFVSLISGDRWDDAWGCGGGRTAAWSSSRGGQLQQTCGFTAV